jgi:3',5'-cyclic AMP phosphodiesterase CpdA
MHIQPERGAAEGVAACLEQVHALDDPPDLILNGGDLVMDAVEADWERASVQFDLWDRVSREHCRLPVVHCLGNHDIWGWHRRSGCVGDEPLFGKRLAMERLGLAERYYRFDRAGWRFLTLDSISRGGADDFEARLDPEQVEWLEAELAATPAETPILVLSHAPLLGGGSLFFTGTPGDRERTGNWVVPGSWLHIDARALHDLFLRHSNVRLCLSGHTHLQDRVEYNGINYINGGAVSGRWWRGNYHHTPPGFGIVDLYDDGTFEYAYVPTAWNGVPNRP